MARLLKTARQVPPASATRWRNNACGTGFSVLMQVPVAAGRSARSLALGKKCFYLNLVRKGKHVLANLVN